MITEEIFKALKDFILNDISNIIMNYLIYRTTPKLRLEINKDEEDEEEGIATCPFCGDQSSSEEGDSGFILYSYYDDNHVIECRNCQQVAFLKRYIKSNKDYDILLEYPLDSSELFEEFITSESESKTIYEIPLLKIMYTIDSRLEEVNCNRKLSTEEIKNFIKDLDKFEWFKFCDCETKDDKECRHYLYSYTLPVTKSVLKNLAEKVDDTIIKNYLLNYEEENKYDLQEILKECIAKKYDSSFRNTDDGTDFKNLGFPIENYWHNSPVVDFPDVNDENINVFVLLENGSYAYRTIDGCA